MNKFSKVLYRYLIGITLVFAAIIIVLVGLNQPINYSTLGDVRPPFIIDTATVRYEDGHEEFLSLPATVTTNRPYTILANLNYVTDFRSKVLFVHVIYSDLECWIDRELVYSYKIPPESLVKSGGYSFHLIEIPQNIQNKTVELKFTPLLKPSYTKYSVMKMDFGSRININLYHFLNKDIWSYILIILLLIFFVVSLLLNIINRRLGLEPGNIRQIGVLCLCIGGYFLSQLWTFNILLQKAHLVIYFIEFTILMIFGIPVIGIVKDHLNAKFQKWFDFFVLLSLLNVVFQYTMTLLHITEFIEMLPLTLAIFFGTIVLIVIAFIKTDPKEYPGRNRLFLSISPIVVTSVLGVLSFWILGRSIFVELLLLGSIAFVIIQLISAANSYSLTASETIKNNIYKELALKDALTGLESRLAYTDYIDKLILHPSELWILSIDLNRLKEINDAFGHNVGDKLLQVFSKLLVESLDQCTVARIFRVGGDEFLAFISDSKFNPEVWEEKLRSHATAYHNVHPDIDLDFAVGIKWYSPAEGDVLQAIDMVDKLMYRDKDMRVRFRTNGSTD